MSRIEGVVVGSEPKWGGGVSRCEGGGGAKRAEEEGE